MEKHLLNWITENDIREIAESGFTAVRLPIGFWNLLQQNLSATHLYVPLNLSLSTSVLHWLFDTTLRYNLSVLVDMHGAAGSQNGIDHSGCNYGESFHLLENQQLTLMAIKAVMTDYSHYANFLGIELLNEPSLDLSLNYHSLLVNFYQEAYQIIRYYHESCLVIINELYDQNYPAWNNVMKEPLYYNVIMDYHLYNWQFPYYLQSRALHLQNALGWETLIEKDTEYHPIIVGEWSLSTGTVHPQVGQPFVDQCVKSFGKSFGWFLWSWKMERNKDYDYWNIQYHMITSKEVTENQNQPEPHVNPLKEVPSRDLHRPF
jgi:glucan 1,3-beta-glucosidase